MRYQFIRKNRCSFPVTKMCRTLNISSSGFYRWQNRKLSPRQEENNRLRHRIRELYVEHRKMAGSPMITADLRSESGFESVGKNRVARHMKAMGLRCLTQKKFVATTDSKHKEPVAKNILNRNFSVSAPNTVWVTDITYIRTYEGWLYLAIVLDLFSRQVIGWSMQSRIETDLVMKALLMALWRRRPSQEVMIHSDQGSQYTSGD